MAEVSGFSGATESSFQMSANGQFQQQMQGQSPPPPPPVEQMPPLPGQPPAGSPQQLGGQPQYQGVLHDGLAAGPGPNNALYSANFAVNRALWAEQQARIVSQNCER